MPAYPALQIPRPFVYHEESLPYLLQSEAGTAAVSIEAFADSDTEFTAPVYTRDTTTDGYGDLESAVPVTAAAFPVDGYVLRATVGGTAEYTASFYVERTSVFFQLLDTALGGLKYLPRDEPGALADDLASVRFGYGNWQLAPAPVVVLNDETEVDRAAAKIDYAAGKLHLLDDATPGDDYRARYQFAYVSDSDCYNFLRLALHTVNARPPATRYTLTSAPPGWEAAITLAAYRQILSRLVFDLGTFRYRRLFEDPAAMLTSVTSVLSATQAELDALLKNIKHRGLLNVGLVRSHNIGTVPARIDGVNWSQYTLLG